MSGSGALRLDSRGRRTAPQVREERRSAGGHVSCGVLSLDSRRRRTAPQVREERRPVGGM